MQRWLDVEAALALSQADVGLLPRETAEEIARAADLGRMDLDALAENFRATNHSLVALLRAHEAACGAGAGEFVHYGATTQDIQDTAQTLEMRDVLDVVDRDVLGLVVVLRDLALLHRDRVMVGRTHGRPALPTTFGVKVAGWLDELLRQAARVDAMRERALVAQLFGGVGTMAGFHGRGPRLLECFADRLGLGVPATSWHASRDRVAEYVTCLAMLTGTLARIADEIRTLGRPELGELEEGWSPGRVGSSTMPHKRNPEACQQVVVLARLARVDATLALEGLVVEHERDSRGLRLEWVAVADVSHYTLTGLRIVAEVLDGLRVHTDRMAEGAKARAEEICTEPLMLALGRHMGKQSAYALVYALSQQARDEGRSLRTGVSRHPQVRMHLGDEELDRIFDPARQVGDAATLVNRVVERADLWLRQRAATGSRPSTSPDR